MTSASAERRREARLRRYATGLGLAIHKSRARDKDRMDYGRYRIEDPATGCVVAGRFPYGYTLSLNDVAEVLEEIDFSRAERAYQAAAVPVPSCADCDKPCGRS